MDLYLKTKDYSVSGETFELYHDPDADMLVTSPQPQDLGKYYESEAYISHTDAREGFIDQLYQGVKKYSLSKKAKLIEKYKHGHLTLLDVGAGTGDFLATTQKRGWTVSGVEPNTAARERAKQKGINLSTTLKELSGKQFDVITLWHVLEHLPDLKDQIKEFKNLLSDDGILVIAVPNFKSYDASHYNKFWAAYDVPRHLWHFSQNSIASLFAKERMHVFQTKPMLFDSFYVSLLSEKYKTGKQNLIKAFCIGLLSNFKAWRSREYSSLIYLLKKD
ncbi:class I SAM-dependent methyltransferase [Spongiimicrobium salis]|uniref:class I SAM-dependent methyltransferase n=1 Tax=Spongiimicrobium salis TaxID=1667022 RepID=UPI00374C9A13